MAKKQHVVFILTFIFSFLVLCIFLFKDNIVFIYKIDALQIFHDSEERFSAYFEPNTKYLKVEYMDKKCEKYDAAIFGSSRAVVYRTEDLNSTFGVASYNMAGSDDTPIGSIQKIQWLDSRGCMPKTIFLPIASDRLMLHDYLKKPYYIARMEHPLVGKKIDYLIDFMFTNLLSESSVNINKKYVEKSESSKDQFIYDISTGDVYYLWDNIFKIEQCSDKQIVADEKKIKEFVTALEEIQKFASAKGAKVILLWNPMPIDVQLKHVETATKLLFLLSKNFQDIHRVPLNDDKLTNHNFYHDWAHFKSSLAKEVIKSSNKISVKQLIGEFEEYSGLCKGKELLTSSSKP